MDHHVTVEMDIKLWFPIHTHTRDILFHCSDAHIFIITNFFNVLDYEQLKMKTM